MKTKGIAKIVIFSLIALALGGMLFAALRFDFIPVSISGFYDNPKSYTVGSGSAKGELHTIEVHWIQGTVTLKPHDEDEIIIREEDPGKEAERLRYRLKDGTLTIQARKSGLNWGTLPTKNLEILIPQETALRDIELHLVAADATIEDLSGSSLCVDSASGAVKLAQCNFGQLEIDSASGSFNASASTLGAVEFDVASGDCVLTDCDVDRLDIDSASGDGKLSGSIGRIVFYTASGDLNLNADVAPDWIEFDSASGDATLSLPSDSEFSAEVDTASGNLTVTGFVGTIVSNGFHCGNGTARYEFDTASGSVTITEK